jgi:hypothetical protein
MMDIVNLYDAAKDEVFRLEILELYRVPGEWEQFQAYLKGKEKASDEEFLSLCKGIRNDLTLGKNHKRVRVIPVNLTDYIKFEMKWYYIDRMQAGELISIIPITVFNQIWPKELEPTDLYIFDSKSVVELHYNNKGEFIKEEIKKNPAKYIELKNKLLSNSIPLLDFIKKNKL